MKKNNYLNLKFQWIGFILIVVFLGSCKQMRNSDQTASAQNNMTEKRIQLISNEAEKKVEVRIGGELFTAYTYPNSIKKPVLYPIITPEGTKITRKFPLEPSVGERVDHPHHVGLWFNYGDVNGLDFWNNSEAIKAEARDGYGTIKQKRIVGMRSGDDEASLEVEMDWLAPDGTLLLVENTTFVFRGEGDEYSIDRITKLTAQDQLVDFKDNKEGVLGIRVIRALEHPSDKPDVFTDANGIPTKVKVLNNDGVNGMYVNAEGIKCLDTWAKRSSWVNLTSTIGDEKISLVILDHKKNVGYPTYWHSRGYGLFAANPLGQSVFSKGKDKLNFKLDKSESVTFKHRIIVASTNLDKAALDSRFESFSMK